jgi:hypothetical protein
VAGSFVDKGKSLRVTLLEGACQFTRDPVGSADSRELQVRRPGTAYRWEFDFASPKISSIPLCCQHYSRLRKISTGALLI